LFFVVFGCGLLFFGFGGLVGLKRLVCGLWLGGDLGTLRVGISLMAVFVGHSRACLG
jgi:hypothetical protein